MDRVEEKRILFKSTAANAFPTLVSRFLGYIRDLLQAFFLGTGNSADAFTIAFTIPNLLRRLTAEGAMTAAFVPTFTELKHDRSRRELWRFADLFFFDLVVVLTGITVIGVVLAPEVARILAFGFRDIPGKWDLTVTLTRLMFPYILFVSLAALARGILNSFKKFFVPASAPVLFNLAVIAAAALMARRSPEPACVFALGVLAGGILQLGIQIPFLWKEGMRFSFGVSFTHPAVVKVAKLWLPGIFGASVYQINFAINRMIATDLGKGRASALYYASRIEELTLGLFAISLAVALLPTFSDQAASGEMERMKKTLDFSLRLTALVTFPAAVGLMVLSRPIIRVLFERGQFDLESTALSSVCLLFFALGLPFISGVKIIAPVFFSLKDTVSPVIIGVGAMTINLGLSFALKGPLNVGGLALALSLSQVANFFALFIWLEKKIGPVRKKSILISAGKSLMAATIMGGMLWPALPALDKETSPFLQRAALLIGLIALAIVLYGLIVFLISRDEAEQLKKLLSWSGDKTKGEAENSVK